MTGALVDFSHIKRARQQTLALDMDSRSAVADIARERWPSNTAKLAAREWNITLDQARSVVAGRASLTTIDQILKAGGWSLYFAVGARVLGQGADQYLSDLRASHDDHSRRLGALLGSWRPVAADRSFDRSDSDRRTGGGRRAVDDRAAERQG